MRLWGSEQHEGDAVAKKPSGIEAMILQFIANNPELKQTIDSFTNGLQAFAVNQQKILTEMQEVKTLLIAYQAQQHGGGGPEFGGKGVISNGVRCPSCGTTGECDCYPDGSGDGRGGSGDGSGIGSVGGSVGG